MKELTTQELEEMFIEAYQELADDRVMFGQIKFSKILMLEYHDPVCFQKEFNNWLDNECEAEYLTEIDGKYYFTQDIKNSKKAQYATEY